MYKNNLLVVPSIDDSHLIGFVLSRYKTSNSQYTSRIAHITNEHVLNLDCFTCKLCHKKRAPLESLKVYVVTYLKMFFKVPNRETITMKPLFYLPYENKYYQHPATVTVKPMTFLRGRRGYFTSRHSFFFKCLEIKYRLIAKKLLFNRLTDTQSIYKKVRQSKILKCFSIRMQSKNAVCAFLYKNKYRNWVENQKETFFNMFCMKDQYFGRCGRKRF